MNHKLINAYFPTYLEAVLGIILIYQQQLFERCEATFQTILYSLCNQLYLYNRDRPFRYPFYQLQNKGSLVRYLSYQKRLLCLLFYISQIDKRFESQVLGVSYYITPTQQKLVEELQGLIYTIYQRQVGSQFFKENNLRLSYLTSIGSSLSQDLKEGLIELSISLLIQPLDPQSPISQHLLTYYTRILSLDLTSSSATKQSFVLISQSTSILSSLIQVSQLLFLEYTLLQKPYYRQVQPNRGLYPDFLVYL